MALTKYVSAKWVVAGIPGMPQTITAIGDDGLEYFIPSWNTDVPPWPDYIINGGSIAPAEPPPDPEPEAA